MAGKRKRGEAGSSSSNTEEPQTANDSERTTFTLFPFLKTFIPDLKQGVQQSPGVKKIEGNAKVHLARQNDTYNPLDRYQNGTFDDS